MADIEEIEKVLRNFLKIRGFRWDEVRDKVFMTKHDMVLDELSTGNLTQEEYDEWVKNNPDKLNP